MTVKEAALFLLLSQNQVHHLITTGVLTAEKDGRRWSVDPKSVEAWKKQRAGRRRPPNSWNKGMVLTMRQWKCSCGNVNQKDVSRCCRKCGKVSRVLPGMTGKVINEDTERRENAAL
jgi:excisionase family DNA binding protein